MDHIGLVVGVAFAIGGLILYWRSFRTIRRLFAHPELIAEAARSTRRDAPIERGGVADETPAEVEAPDGDESPEKLASIALSASAPGSVRAQALRSLARLADASTAGPTIVRALASPEPIVRRAAVVAAGQLKLAGALPPLVSMASAASGDTAAALATAIGEIGSPEGEAAALALLANEDPGVRIAAARALGKIGGREAVAPLLEFAGGIVSFGDLRTTAADAIRAIQARLGPSERGTLSIEESRILSAEGGLSDPGGTAGGLALPETRRVSEGDSSA